MAHNLTLPAAGDLVEDAEPMWCAHCGCAIRIESNRDWHRLFGDHDEECLYEPDEEVLMYPATVEGKATMLQAWNRRAGETNAVVAECLPVACLGLLREALDFPSLRDTKYAAWQQAVRQILSSTNDHKIPSSVADLPPSK